MFAFPVTFPVKRAKMRIKLRARFATLNSPTNCWERLSASRVAIGAITKRLRSTLAQLARRPAVIVKVPLISARGAILIVNIHTSSTDSASKHALKAIHP